MRMRKGKGKVEGRKSVEAVTGKGVCSKRRKREKKEKTRLKLMTTWRKMRKRKRKENGSMRKLRVGRKIKSKKVRIEK